VTNARIYAAQLDALRLSYAIQVIRKYLESDAAARRKLPSTSTNLRLIAGQYTGVTYPRSRKGLTDALNDLLEVQRQRDVDANANQDGSAD